MNFVYILRCADGSYYSGWTTDISKRLAAHNAGAAGAKYTKSRRPVTLVHAEAYPDKSQAMRREAAIKKLTRAQKAQIVAQTVAEQAEFLEVYDTRRVLCGTLPRPMVHGCGILHRVVHLLVFQTKENIDGVWLQQRGLGCGTLPGFYDWAATGHIDPGEDAETAVLREAREENGLVLSLEEIVHMGSAAMQPERNGVPDREIAEIFLYFAREDPAFAPGEEVLRMVWTPCAAVTDAFEKGAALPVINQSGEHEEIGADMLSQNKEEWKKVCRFLKKRKRGEVLHSLV